MKRDENVSFIEKIVFDHVHGDVIYNYFLCGAFGGG
jgi:hypothetical protein